MNIPTILSSAVGSSQRFVYMKAYLEIDATQILHKQKQQITVIQFLCQLSHYDICLRFRLGCTIQHVFNVYKILAHILLCLKGDVFHRRNRCVSATTYLLYLLVAAFQRVYRFFESLYHFRRTLLGFSKKRHVFFLIIYFFIIYAPYETYSKQDLFSILWHVYEK